MPHISQKKIDQQVFNKIMTQFAKTFQEADDRSRSLSVMKELFTKTEKIMFAKRITMIYMLEKNISFENISEIIHLSPTTIAKFSLAMDAGKYKETISIISKKGKLADEIERLLYGILPPRVRRPHKNLKIF